MTEPAHGAGVVAIVPCPPGREAELFRLRARVWVEEGADPAAFPAGEWRDVHDATRQHWIVTDGGVLVGGASLALHPALDALDEPEAYVGVPLPAGGGLIAAPGRVVVLASHRGGGIAQRLLDVQDAEARARGAVLAVRQASPAMRRLLERRGWRYHHAGPPDARFPGVTFSVMSLPL